MALLSEYAEVSEIAPGKFQHIQYLKKIAYRENGILQTMAQAWTDSGDSLMPTMADRVPIRCRVANSGMRRMFPIPGDDNSYLEIGAPFVKVGGVWTQVSLGTPSRSANVMTWTRPQTITRVLHGGHFVKLDIELRGGFVPEDSQVAFPVGLNGLTRSGNAIRKNGIDVMQLTPLMVEDAANDIVRREITHQFVNLNGQPYLLLTLPSLTGMSRPRIDPTLTLQPDATAGIDTMLWSGGSSNNYGILDRIEAGRNASSVDIERSLIRFDLSSIPAGSTATVATLTMTCHAEAATTDANVAVHRALTQWFEGDKSGAAPSGGVSGSTWANRDGLAPTVAWAGGAGGGSGTDRAAVATATTLITAPGVFNWDVLADVTAWLSGTNNYGWWMIGGEGANQLLKRFRSSDYVTAGDRPQLAVTYTLPDVQPISLRRRGTTEPTGARRIGRGW